MKKEILVVFLVGYIKFIEMQTELEYRKSLIQATLSDCTMIKEKLGITYERAAFQAYSKLSTAFLKLYTDREKIIFSLVNSNQAIRQSPHFNINLPIIIISHGYLGDSEAVNIVDLANEIKSLGVANVLTYDHSSLTKDTYFIASTNAQYAGEALGAELVKMYSSGVRNFHLIGFSLGAQVSSFAGKLFQKATRVNIDRITGLDPAGPCYFKETPDKRLTKTDANFVDCIHTCAGRFGITIPSGHVDFFPNGGIRMPGCWTNLCSHVRSLLFFTESVRNKNGFLGVNCNSWNTFIKGGCIESSKTSMGYWLQDNTNFGSFYLKTSDTPPFALNSDTL